MNTQAKTNQYFNTVLYARVRFNEIKIIEPKKGPKYGAVNVTIYDLDDEGQKVYQNADLIMSGDAVKKMLWAHHDKWPADRMKKTGPAWYADVNIGSLRTEAYQKKDGTVGAVLKGRLINIRALRIGEETILGEVAKDFQPAVLVAPGYINLINPEKGVIKFAMLDGPVDKPEYRSINLTFGEVPAINELIARNLIPKGYTHRDENPKIFANLEISGVFCEGFEGKDGNPAAALKGVLSGVRYLKANDKIIIGGKDRAA